MVVPAAKVILILTKFGILISTWFQIVPFGLRFSKQFLDALASLGSMLETQSLINVF